MQKKSAISESMYSYKHVNRPAARLWTIVITFYMCVGYMYVYMFSALMYAKVSTASHTLTLLHQQREYSEFSCSSPHEQLYVCENNALHQQKVFMYCIWDPLCHHLVKYLCEFSVCLCQMTNKCMHCS